MKILPQCIMKKLLLFGMFCILAFSCNKLVDAGASPISVSSVDIYTTDATAASVLTGIYATISQRDMLGTSPLMVSLYAGLSADEFTLASGITDAKLNYYTNSLNSLTGTDFWRSATIYNLIFNANSAIEGITNATTLTPSIKQHLLGEAKFIRAFLYFNLVNLYGDVPLVLAKDYTVNNKISRTLKTDVYKQIIQDLKEAQSQLSNKYLAADIITSSTERLRPTQMAATALLARVYLYTGDYVNAEQQATAVISNSLYSLPTAANAFLKGSAEAIWQIQPVTVGRNTQEAAVYVLPTSGPNNNFPVYLSTALLNSFETGDARRTAWVGNVTVGATVYPFPNKYKVNTLNAPVTEYSILLRLGEVYLIRSEARAQQDNLTGANSATSDLNIIRTRGTLSPYSGATDKASILAAILKERRVELFSEWGHRWFDLKRTGNLDAVMTVATTAKGGKWSTNQQLYPINQSELSTNPSLIQNPGY
jgi:hypothetical protein